MKNHILHLLLCTTLALSACASAPSAQPAPGKEAKPAQAIPVAKPRGPEDVKSLLWVGNSFFYYNNSMHGHVGRLLTDSGKRGMRASSATISGSGINWHDLDAHFKPGGVASYSFVGDNEVRFNTIDKPFDAVMIMDCSQCPIHPQLGAVFTEYAKKHSETARKYRAQPIFFMSWAYADKPEMTDTLAAAYIKAGKDNNALVVPAGLAFAASTKARPDIVLTTDDKRHPSLAGTYLGACVVLASVYKTDPVGLKYNAGLSAETAAHLQRVAFETVKSFEAQQGRGSL